MASATTSFEQIANVGRETVRTTFDYVGENETPLLNWFFSKGKELLTEQGIRVPIETRRPGGHTLYDRSNVDFRDPVSLETDSMRVYPVWYAMPFKLDGSTLRALKRGDANQFMSYKRYMASVTAASMKRLNQLMHGDGTGAVAVITSVVTGTGNPTTLNFQSLASSGAGEAETKGAKRLEIGHTYSVVNSSTLAVKIAFTVLTIASATQITANVFYHSANTASGDAVVDGGTSNTTSAYKKALSGLRELVAATGPIQNVLRTDVPELKSPRYNGGDNPITPFAFRFAKDLVRIGSNKDEGSNRTIVMTPGIEGTLANQQFGYRRYNGNEVVKGVTRHYQDEDGDTYLIDADGAEDRVYILDGSGWKVGEEKPFGAFDEDGNDIRMLVGSLSNGSDKFAGSIGWGGNIIKEGRPRMDAYIDRVSQTDVAQQISL